ncbi:hypothetical protein DOTSEDRAFT_73888 [Dothistroma septosporum NZE10]|uniref:Uncharacterized protein n=1 Tax=Dothistroma septosporum (strain NZE10 / CBS 128990) TaxID=675120 RepID=N1PGX9_DOTSN|nr:hypothetical protein DOTSEDRAFT_73888 [Dothistroma septosporum NZE10]
MSVSGRKALGLLGLTSSQGQQNLGCITTAPQGRIQRAVSTGTDGINKPTTRQRPKHSHDWRGRTPLSCTRLRISTIHPPTASMAPENCQRFAKGPMCNM